MFEDWDSTRSMDCLDWNDGEAEDAVAVEGTGLASPDMVMRGLVGVRRAPALEKVVELAEKCLDSATVAVGAKTPALDMADLFAAVQRRMSVTEPRRVRRMPLEELRASEKMAHKHVVMEANKQGRAAVQMLQRDRILTDEPCRGIVVLLVLLVARRVMGQPSLMNETVLEQYKQGSPALLIKL